MIKIHRAKIMHHFGAGVYIGGFCFLMYKASFTLLSKSLLPCDKIWKFSIVEWLHVLQEDIFKKMAEYPEKCSITLVAKCLFVLPI